MNDGSISYNDFEKNEEVNLNDNKSGIKKVLIIIITTIVILLIILALFLLIKNSTNNKVNSITFKENTAQLIIGETKNIELVIDAKKPEKVPITWNSDNLEIATVSNGTITAIKEGTTTITAKYINKDGKEFIAECQITVVDNKPIIKYELSNKNWDNEEIIITINAESKTGIEELKYTLNCTENCEYINIGSDKITINEPGINKVYIIATTKNNVSTQEIVEVKIDKTPPEIKLVDKNTTYSGVNKVEVCATCKDNESGCSQEKICKEFTDDKTNETIEVTDKAGNVSKTESFNVKINKSKPVCKFTEPTNTSFNVNNTVTLTLECSDAIAGIKDTNLEAKNFNMSSANILQITNIEKSEITKGYKYVLTVKGIATGTSKITLNKDVIYSNSGLAHDALISKDYTVTVACTRRRECGCEAYHQITASTSITKPCSPNPATTDSKWISCTSNGPIIGTNGQCNWSCQYKTTGDCKQYKCC